MTICKESQTCRHLVAATFAAAFAASLAVLAFSAPGAQAAAACSLPQSEDVFLDVNQDVGTDPTFDAGVDAYLSCEVIPIGGGTADNETNVNASDPFEDSGLENDWVYLTKYQVAGGAGSAEFGVDSDTATGFGDGSNYSDWIVIQDYLGDAAGTGPGALDLTNDPGANGQSGYFVVTEQARTIYDEMLILLKQKGNFYVYDITDIAGLPEYIYYTTPFTTGGGGAQDISHISFYGRVGLSSVTDVPVPAAAPMLLLALGGLALFRRRRG